MATDAEIVNGMNNYLRANGFTCGRSYVNIGNLAKGLASTLPNESPQSLEPKIRRLAGVPQYRFKTASQGNDISASDPNDPRCGSN